MLTEDLARSLREHADAAGRPTPDLMLRVQRRAAQRRARRTAALGSTAAVVLTAVAAGTLALRPHLTSGGGQTAPHTAVLTAAQQVDPANDGLTGSVCDEPGQQRPLNYLDQPCAAPQPGTSTRLLDDVYGMLNHEYVGATAPRLRLLADDTAASHRALAELWDADHPETPTLLIGQKQGGADIDPAPAGDPPVLVVGEVLAGRGDVVAVRVDPAGRVLPLHHGLAGFTTYDQAEYERSEVVGLDSAGTSRPGWTVPLARNVQAPDPCDRHRGVGTCDGYGSSHLLMTAPPAGGLCQSPTGTPPAQYLDWPCANPVDSTTANRAGAALASVVGSHRGLKEPRVRLLADTRDDGNGEDGPAATLIEVWDAAGTGPAVLAGATTSHRTGSDLAVFIDGAIPGRNRPLVFAGSFSGRGRLVFSRNDVATVRLSAGNTTLDVHPSGGVAFLAINGAEQHTASTWLADGLDRQGRHLGSAPWSEPYAAPCTQISSTCVPVDATPVFPPTPTPTATR